MSLDREIRRRRLAEAMKENGMRTRCRKCGARMSAKDENGWVCEKCGWESEKQKQIRWELRRQRPDMRTMRIYDYANHPTDVELKDKNITAIYVAVKTGDEFVTVMYEDGEWALFDSSSTRSIDYEDGDYTVQGDEIERWLRYKPKKTGIASYERLAEFGRIKVV